mgnify:FL=1
MTQQCIDQFRVKFSCKLVELAKRYDSLLCMNLDTTKTLANIILARNLLTTLCIIQDSSCYDTCIAEKIINKLNTLV